MLDAVTVLTKGGLVLWSKAYTDLPSPHHPIDSLIRNVLIQERAGEDVYTTDAWSVKWAFENNVGLIFVVVYQKILQLAYIDELLEAFKRLFIKDYAPRLSRDVAGTSEPKTDLLGSYEAFEVKFDKLVAALEAEDRKGRSTKGPRKFANTKGFQNTLAGSKKPQGGEPQDNTSNSSDPGRPPINSGSGDSLDAKLNALGLSGRRGGKAGRRGGGPGRGGKSGKSSPSSSKPSSAEDSPVEGRRSKVLRTWTDGVAGTAPGTSLDYSDSTGLQAEADMKDLIGSKLGTTTASGLYDAAEMDDRPSDDEDLEDDQSDGGYDDDETDVTNEPKSVGVFSFFKSLTSAKTLTNEDIDPAMAKMREHLIQKNVAADVADHLCDSVRLGLAGQSLGRFSSLTAAVKTQMETALRRILTPRTSIDVLRDIFAAQATHRPYTMAFVGVNGVGKSTNLSKVCFWLLQNDLKVLVAACDTFRAGAVEQLRVHQRNLKLVRPGAVVELFDRGYGKDPAAIAKDAITFAKQNGFDVVLIDTAGRMQDNEPLMRALAKLVTVNMPDKVVFVGEALVGNEAVDQLTKFNQALKDFSGVPEPRQIDGMILTKFDTIDDKVGAALSMTYTTGQPILFVGTGQTYTDLRKMNVKSIVNSLLAR
ncbi:SRP54-type protein [Phlyctochytrium arcticum]|nr:SRP54-type protein [Phlyctochytrium arcticum]